MQHALTKTKYKVTKNLLLIGILILGILSALIGLVAYFGQYMGTFVISIKDTSRYGIQLSETAGFENPTTCLTADVIDDVWPIAYIDLDIDSAKNTDGSSSTENYIAYTFYIRNAGDAMVDVEYSIDLNKMTQGLELCSRLMLFENDICRGIYKWEDNYIDKADRTPLKYYKQHETSNVCTDYINSFMPGDVVKYTVLIWLEGWDIDCKDDKKGGSISYTFDFNIVCYYGENILNKN